MTVDTKRLRRIGAAVGLELGRESGEIIKSAADAIDAQAAEIDRWKDLFETTAKSVCAALERHGVQSVDDPGEAIDVLVAEKNAEIARLREALQAADNLLGLFVRPGDEIADAVRMQARAALNQQEQVK